MAGLSRLAGVPVEEVKGLAGKRGAALHKAGIRTVADLLFHVPRTYIDRSRSAAISDVPLNEEVTVVVTVKSVSIRRPRRNLAIVEAVVGDGTSTMKVVWFNQTFRARQLDADSEVALSGKVERFKGRLQMKSPAVDVLSSPTESLDTGRVVPIHPAVGEVTAGVFRRALHNALIRSRPVADPVPSEIVERVGVVERDWAYGAIHFPDRIDDVVPARNRLVFDELFRLEVALALQKRHNERESRGIVHRGSGHLVERFVSGLPYELTADQERVLGEIRSDLARPHGMHRLLQGEVGSGKTVVAIATLLSGVEGGWQGAVMAPTEVLAEQHFSAVVDLLDQAGLGAEQEGGGADLGMASLFAGGEEGDAVGVRVALLTGARAVLSHRRDASRVSVFDAIRSGRVELVIGTHALIQEGVEFHRLGVAVVDEQHRFGVAQRVELRAKADEVDPDLLIMTATPIPRTLSMTLYGDLDVSVIDEMPPGRVPVKTMAISNEGQDTAWELVRREAGAGRQAFVVCPLVEDSPKVEAASATAEYERLTGVLDGLRLGLIHGQLHPRDKEAVMASFRAGELDVLVATTVIEVGIDVPNATVMVIEDAHRFGLSQLHQLRGRVGRGRHRGTCVLISDPTTEEGEARVEAMVATTDGFELANTDLEIRGQGTVFGMRQSGMTDLRLADILRDIDLLVAARREAFALVEDDPDLNSHPDLAAEIRALLGEEVAWLFVS
ncbi:ATP-dependent DNA helicase RecG [soil metagenome]